MRSAPRVFETALPTESPHAGPSVDEEAFRDALRLFASGVTVITTRNGRGGVHGMTATAFSSLSLQPPLVLVAVAKGSRCHRMIEAEKLFGINILADDQEAVSRHFGGTPSPEQPVRFAELDDVPVLAEAMVKLACRLVDAAEGGDHSIFIGQVLALETAPGRPLIHFGGRYRTVE